MNSSMFKLNLQDAIRAGAVVVIAAVLGSLQQAVTQHGFDVAAYDWATILDVAMTAGGAYLAKNFLSDGNGKLGGVL